MNIEKRNRLILTLTIITLLLSVIVISVYLYIKRTKEKSNILNAHFNQVFASDYEINYIDKNYFYEYSNDELISFINSSGKLVYEFIIPIKYNNIYSTKDNNYIIFYNENNNLEISIFDGKQVYSIYSSNTASDVKPIIYKNNDISYLIAFTYTYDNNTYIYNIDKKSLITLENKLIIADKYTNNTYYTNNNQYLVIKDLYDNQGIIDIEGNNIIDTTYNNINTLPNNNFIIQNDKNKYGIIDSNNDEIIKPIYNVIAPYNNYYLIVNNKNKLALYDNEYNQIIDFKMNYNQNNKYDYRNNIKSIYLYKKDDNIIIINNYLELNNKIDYKYHDMYIIKDNKITNNYEQNTLNIKDTIYTYNKNNVLTIYDNTLNVIKELNIKDISKIITFKNITNNTIELTYESNNEINTLYFNNNYEQIEFTNNNIIHYTDKYYLTLQDNILTLYDNDNNKIDDIKANNILINENYLIIDKNIYEVMTK